MAQAFRNQQQMIEKGFSVALLWLVAELLGTNHQDESLSFI